MEYATTIIYVKDRVKETLDFYVAAFGFQILYYEENLKFGELNSGATSIMIASYEAGEFMVGDSFRRSRVRRPENVELAFVTADVVAAYERAIEAGATRVREPLRHEWGQTTAYVNSVEGTLIGLLTPPPAAPTAAS